MVPVRYAPGPKETTPPPSAAALSIALWMLAVFTVSPGLTPKSAAWYTGSAIPAASRSLRVGMSALRVHLHAAVSGDLADLVHVEGLQQPEAEQVRRGIHGVVLLDHFLQAAQGMVNRHPRDRLRLDGRGDQGRQPNAWSRCHDFDRSGMARPLEPARRSGHLGRLYTDETLAQRLQQDPEQPVLGCNARLPHVDRVDGDHAFSAGQQPGRFRRGLAAPFVGGDDCGTRG